MPALSPVDDQLDDLTLTVGERVFRASYDGETSSIPLDGIAVTDEAWITLEGRADNQRLTGYGRLTEPVRIAASDDVEVTIPFRRPYAYLATNTNVKAFHTGVDVLDAERFELAGFHAGTTAVSAVPGGRYVAVSPAGQIALLDSATHQPVPGASAPAAAVNDLVATPDGRYVIALHTTAPTGITIVDVEALVGGGGASATRAVEVAMAGLLTADATNAYVITNAGQGCSGDSQVLTVTLDGSGDPKADSLGTCVLDAKVDPTMPRLVVGTSRNTLEIHSLAEDAGSPLSLAVMSPTAVAIAAGRAVALGRRGVENDDRLVMASMLLDGSDQRTVEVEVPDFIQVAFVQDGDQGSRFVSPDVIETLDASTLPDGSLVAALVKTHYVAPTWDFFFEPVDSDLWDYVLLDVIAGQVVQWARSDCNDPVDPDDCGVVIEGQDLMITTRDRFTPLRISILNGDR